LYGGAAFWGPASGHFAQSSFGTVYLLLRSFATVPAWRPGVLPNVEFPNIMNQSDVSALRVLLVTNMQMPDEHCNNGSLKTLNATIATRWTQTSCVEDPLAVLHFICDDTILPEVNITDKDFKCRYYKEVKDYFGEEKANLNYNCSMDAVSMTKNFLGTFWHSKSKDCPIPPWNRKSNLGPILGLIFGVVGVVVVAIIVTVLVVRRKTRSGYNPIQ
jgi:hypothetical protein